MDMKYFNYDHLPPKLAQASSHFALVAEKISNNAEVIDESQRQIALQKLLEAKDAYVRSFVK